MIDQLERHKERMVELEKIEAEALKLRNAPAGFANDPASRIHWTIRWIDENWAIYKSVDKLQRKNREAKNQIQNLKEEIKSLKEKLKAVTEAVSAATSD